MRLGNVKHYGRRLALTSLIDVIFLLLLFFMLTSTFSRFSDIEFSSGGSGLGFQSGSKSIFLKLQNSDIRINGETVIEHNLLPALEKQKSETTTNVILSVTDDITAQRLIDVVANIKTLDWLTLTVVR